MQIITIDYVTIASTGNAKDFGDLTICPKRDSDLPHLKQLVEYLLGDTTQLSSMTFVCEYMLNGKCI